MRDPILAFILCIVALATVLHSWFAVAGTPLIAGIGIIAFLALAFPRASASRRAFVLVGAGLALLTFLISTDWPEILVDALGQGAFIATFFMALATLRAPASTSHSIRRCGAFLASQPPGKRYLALTNGGHLFALILNYGSIQLLGGLTESIAAQEPNNEVREIRTRRMLLAIQRGFCASLCWSPLAFSMAITTSIVQGASWSATASIAIFNACLFTFVGWALDTIIKPKLSGPRPARTAVVGSFRDVKPLALLLVIIFSGVAILEVLTGLRIVYVVMVFVPIVAAIWLWLEEKDESNPVAKTAGRLKTILLKEIPSYQSEMVLLTMAGIIGSLGSAIAVPVIENSGIDLSVIPAPVLLAVLVWIIPLFGQLGMNPILSVSLFAPLLPSPDVLGVSPAAMVGAITAGWALTGATSPFTATTMLVGRLGHTSALNVGLGWNRMFFFITATVMSLTTIAYSLWFA